MPSPLPSWPPCWVPDSWVSESQVVVKSPFMPFVAFWARPIQTIFWWSSISLTPLTASGGTSCSLQFFPTSLKSTASVIWLILHIRFLNLVHAPWCPRRGYSKQSLLVLCCLPFCSRPSHFFVFQTFNCLFGWLHSRWFSLIRQWRC